MTTITVLCDQSMTDLLPPLEKSLLLDDRYGGYLVAVFDEAQLLAIDETTVTDSNAWWRECGSCNTTIPWKPKVLRRMHLLDFLCDYHGISSERNVAVAINEVARNAGMTPIELVNWCVENGPVRAR